MVEFFDKPSENLYEKPLFDLTSQLEQFSKSQKIPLYAFGGSIPFRGKLSECLALSGDFFQPELNGAEELTWVFNQAQKSQCYTEGPRNLAPILNRVNNYCEFMQEKDPLNYEVLIVLLDGSIDDWKTETRLELLRSSALPLSILFVAIGENDLGSLPYDTFGGV